MARRYIGHAVVYIQYYDEGDYRGSVVADGASWKFKDLHAPACGLPYAYDSPEAYDKMAQSAVSFGSYYTSMNRSEEVIDGYPSGIVSDTIDAAISCSSNDDGTYEVRRRK